MNTHIHLGDNLWLQRLKIVSFYKVLVHHRGYLKTEAKSCQLEFITIFLLLQAVRVGNQSDHQRSKPWNQSEVTRDHRNSVTDRGSWLQVVQFLGVLNKELNKTASKANKEWSNKRRKTGIYWKRKYTPQCGSQPEQQLKGPDTESSGVHPLEISHWPLHAHLM